MQSQTDREKLQTAMTRADGLQMQLDEERSKHQQQMSSVRKEIGMALVREKEACIHLLQGPPDSLRDKIDVLLKQKEQLKHQLLSGGEVAFSTGESGPYLGG